MHSPSDAQPEIFTIVNNQAAIVGQMSSKFSPLKPTINIIILKYNYMRTVFRKNWRLAIATAT